MNTSDLTGPALDWAVAQANGDTDLDWFVYEGEFYFGSGPSDPAPVAFMPSRNWFDGGPIIERERITIEWLRWDDKDSALGVWGAQKLEIGRTYQEGFSPLQAAMRCYVASALGDEIDTPDGL